MFEEVNLILTDIESADFQEANNKIKNASSVIFSTYLCSRDNLLYLINDSETKEDVGVICFYDMNPINQNACIEGFVIDDKYIKQLVASYVQLIYKGMTELNLNKIYAKHLIGDNYYKQIYDFLRFTLEGDYRDHVKLSGKFYSIQVRSLLKHEFNRYYLAGDHISKLCQLEGF